LSRHLPSGVIAATDGGLLIPGLGRAWNPVTTARFAEGSTSRSRAEALLELASELTGQDRLIGWTEALAVAKDGEVLAEWLAHGPPGELAADLPVDFDADAGFWIPYVWRCPEYGGRRLSELTGRERLARRDHWAVLGELLSEWAANLEA
jgi:hypothetical protein